MEVIINVLSEIWVSVVAISGLVLSLFEHYQIRKMDHSFNIKLEKQKSELNVREHKIKMDFEKKISIYQQIWESIIKCNSLKEDLLIDFKHYVNVCALTEALKVGIGSHYNSFKKEYDIFKEIYNKYKLFYNEDISNTLKQIDEQLFKLGEMTNTSFCLSRSTNALFKYEEEFIDSYSMEMEKLVNEIEKLFKDDLMQ